jgi:HAD superfamily hydrolase (TIGR01509 family)
MRTGEFMPSFSDESFSRAVAEYRQIADYKEAEGKYPIAAFMREYAARLPQLNLPEQPVRFTPNALHPGTRAIVFDMYMTLLQLEGGEQPEGVLAPHLDATPDAIKRTHRQFVVGSFLGQITPLERVKGVMSYYGRMPDPQEAERLLDIERQAYIDAARPYPGIGQLLASYREAGFKLAIASNTCGLGVEAALHHGLPQLVDFAAFSCQVYERKPFSGIYERICKELDVSPDQCLFVDDGSDLGVEGAQLFGMTTVRVDHPGVKRVTFPFSHYQVDSITEMTLP